MNAVFFIGKRYLFTLSNKSAINLISILSSIAIVVASMSLFVVLSVFSGLKDLSLSFVNQSDPDLKITPKIGKTILIDETFRRALKNEFVVDYTFLIEEKALLRYKNKDVIVEFKGVSENFTEITNYNESLQIGNWFSEKSSGIVVGSGIAQKLSLALNDQLNPLELIIPNVENKDDIRADQAFLSEYLIGVGVFFNTEEANSKNAFIDFDLARNLLSYKIEEVSSIAIKLKPIASINEVKNQLNNVLDNQYNIKTRTELNESLHRMLNTENLVLYIIFFLIILMVMFTLFGALLMMIIEKKQNIKTLNSLGMTLKSIKMLFLVQGTSISVIGGFIGLILGLLIVFIQQKFEMVMINESLAYPVVFDLKNVFDVILTVISLGFFMSWLSTISLSKKFFSL